MIRRHGDSAMAQSEIQIVEIKSYLCCPAFTTLSQGWHSLLKKSMPQAHQPQEALVVSKDDGGSPPKRADAANDWYRRECGDAPRHFLSNPKCQSGQAGHSSAMKSSANPWH